MIAPTANPMTIAANVVPQKNASVRRPSRPSLLRFPRPATPTNTALATSGITTMESRLRNSVPTGRSALASASSTWFCVAAATRPSTKPASRPAAIQMWFLIVCALYFPDQ